MSQIMDGKKIAEEKFFKLKEEVERESISASLAVVSVGNNEVSQVYIKMKKKKLEEVGLGVSVYNLPDDISEDELCSEVSLLKEDGVIVQLPLPEKINKQKVFNFIPREKDVDLLSSSAIGSFYSGSSDVLPPVVAAVKTLLDSCGVDYRERSVVLIGSGVLVGKPLSLFFIDRKNTVSVLNSKTKNIQSFTKEADIIVSGTGVSEMLKGEMIKEGAVVIDAGTSSEGGVLKGDVELGSVKEKASFISPVPGGVGPLTVYHLAENLVRLGRKNK